MQKQSPPSAVELEVDVWNFIGAWRLEPGVFSFATFPKDVNRLSALARGPTPETHFELVIDPGRDLLEKRKSNHASSDIENRELRPVNRLADFLLCVIREGVTVAFGRPPIQQQPPEPVAPVIRETCLQQYPATVSEMRAHAAQQLSKPAGMGDEAKAHNQIKFSPGSQAGQVAENIGLRKMQILSRIMPETRLRLPQHLE